MKHNWEYKRLGDVCAVKSGYTPTSDDLHENGEYPYFKVAEMNLPGNEKYLITSPSYLRGNVKTFPANSIVFPKNGAAVSTNKKRILITNSVVDLNTAVMLVDSKISVPYIYNILQNIDFSQLVKRGAIPTLNISALKDIIIPVPDLKIQEQIVAELDKLNEMISTRKEQLKELDNLTQSLFYDTFGDPISNPKGWPISKLKNLSSLITNGTTPKGGQAVYVDSGITFFRSQNVWRNKIIMDDIAYLDEITNASMKSSMLKHNDILITKTGRINTENSSLGRSALFEGEDYTANINGHVYLVRLNEEMCPRFVLSILLSPSFHDLIRKVCVGAIDKRQLNLTHIEQFPIITPPLELQERFVAQIELIEKQKETIEASIVELQTLLDSRMDYWFN